MRRLGVAGRLYAGSVIVAGAAIVPFGLFLHPLPPVGTSPFWEFLFLVGATQLAALMPIRWSSGTHSVTTAPLIALGLLVPGGGVAIAAWLCLFDGRLPGRDLPLWQALFNRANLAISYSSVSLAVALVPASPPWDVPLKTIISSLGVLAINYPLTAVAFSFVTKTPVLTILARNVRLAAVQAVLILGFAGGTLFVLLQRPVGYLMAPALVGVLIAVRANVAHAQRQAEARHQTLQLAAQALDARDKYTESHSQRVAELAAQIGRALGLGFREVEDLRTAGSLHDLGKIGIPDSILNKAGRLTPDEWEIMRTHSDIGADMISQHSALARVAPFVRHHHERWDGTGYPQGLHQHEIPLGARILAVADSFDTMTSPRLYRQSFMDGAAALREVLSFAGRWYDPRVVAALGTLHKPPVRIATPGGHRRSTLPSSLAVLIRRPRFAQFVLGMSISSLGDPLTTVATMVSVYLVTKQPMMLAAVYVTKALATIVIGALGGIAPDRWDRRRLVLTLELGRGAILLITPLALHETLLAIFPIIFALAAVNAVVQPTRQAIVPELVSEPDVGSGMAAIASTTMIASVLGFPVAAGLLWLTKTTTWLFVMDGLTFAVAGALVVGIGNVGGHSHSRTLGSGLVTTWRIRYARPQLVASTLGAFFISMSFPTLLVLAYRLAHTVSQGAQVYTLLEATLAAGVFIGSILVSQTGNVGSMRLVIIGLAMMGILSIGIALTSWLVVTALLLFFASVGNAIYGVANQTALLRAGDRTNRGRIMSARFAIAQTALIAGAVIGGFVTASVGPNATYGLLGLGLVLVAGILLLARERITSAGTTTTRSTKPLVQVEVKMPVAPD